jgi:ketosteroid isomerase-like protein
MSIPKHIAIANEWFRAFNAQDLDALLALYHDAAEHYSPKLKQRQPETNGYVKGKDQLRAWWQGTYDLIPSLKYVPSTFTANEQRIFVEYIRLAEGEDEIRVAEVFEIRDGVIVASRVYHG